MQRMARFSRTCRTSGDSSRSASKVCSRKGNLVITRSSLSIGESFHAARAGPMPVEARSSAQAVFLKHLVHETGVRTLGFSDEAYEGLLVHRHRRSVLPLLPPAGLRTPSARPHRHHLQAVYQPLFQRAQKVASDAGASRELCHAEPLALSELSAPFEPTLRHIVHGAATLQGNRR